MRTPPAAGASGPTLECDLVMKGGITSGVIYPGVVVELSGTYRLRSVGGASAGAIAAAAAAAAEYGRQVGAAGPGAGFDGLAAMPAELGAQVAPGVTRLRALFQPGPRTQATLAVLLAALGGAGAAGKALRALAALLVRRPGAWFLAAGLAGAGWLGWEAGRAGAAGLAAALAVAAAAWFVLLALGGAVAFVVAALGALRANGFGLCDGFAAPAAAGRAGIEPLTPWLDRKLRTLAGLDRPLTFGDLAAQGIELAVTTTSVTHLRPYRLPFHADDPQLFFSEREFRRLFPAEVVDALLRAAAEETDAARAHPRHRRSRARVRAARAAYRRAHAGRGGGDRLVPLPRGGGLPVVVAARMSLSFPLLVSAVPLWGIDWGPRRNRAARPAPEHVWFSDGGICSNMPIHFFDAALPTRPTFAINLRAAAAGEPAGAWLPTTNGAGMAQRWCRMADGRGGVLDFLLAIVETMQTWVDETLLVTPGFRDRTAHVSHTASEGGLNLDMSAGTIRALSERGAEAGMLLRDRFSWRNHLWVRFRTLANVLERFVGPALARFGPGTARRAELLDLVQAHTRAGSYRLSAAQAECAREVIEGLDDVAAGAAVIGVGLTEGAPRPTPELRVRPRF